MLWATPKNPDALAGGIFGVSVAADREMLQAGGLGEPIDDRKACHQAACAFGVKADDAELAASPDLRRLAAARASTAFSA